MQKENLWLDYAGHWHGGDAVVLVQRLATQMTLLSERLTNLSELSVEVISKMFSSDHQE